MTMKQPFRLTSLTKIIDEAAQQHGIYCDYSVFYDKVQRAKRFELIIFDDFQTAAKYHIEEYGMRLRADGTTEELSSHVEGLLISYETGECYDASTGELIDPGFDIYSQDAEHIKTYSQMKHSEALTTEPPDADEQISYHDLHDLAEQVRSLTSDIGRISEKLDKMSQEIDQLSQRCANLEWRNEVSANLAHDAEVLRMEEEADEAEVAAKPDEPLL